MRLRNSGSVGRRPIMESFFGIYAQDSPSYGSPQQLYVEVLFVEGQVGKMSRSKSRQSDPMSAVEVKREAVLCNYSPSASQPQPDYSSTTEPKTTTLDEQNRQPEKEQSEKYTELNLNIIKLK